jgi:hypothetical protein
VSEDILDKENPRRNIGQNTTFVKQLIQLLTEMPNEESIVKGIITLLEILPWNKEISNQIENTITQKSKGKSVSKEVDWGTLFSW